MAEMGWRNSTFDLVEWSAAYSARRYGSLDANSKQAWNILVRTVYNCSDNHENHNHGIPVRRPSLQMRYSVWYEHDDLIRAWGHLVSAPAGKLKNSGTFRYVAAAMQYTVIAKL